ncbi:MAG: hypothetical protein P8I90_03915 [Glaciecola sp.]|nr:hypothetical protein [Glaciecola sp.]
MKLSMKLSALTLALAFSANVFAHGAVTPQAIDTSTIPQLGE